MWIHLTPLPILLSLAHLPMIIRTYYSVGVHRPALFVVHTHSHSFIPLLSYLCLHLKPGDSYQCPPGVHYQPSGNYRQLQCSQQRPPSDHPWPATFTSLCCQLSFVSYPAENQHSFSLAAKQFNTNQHQDTVQDKSSFCPTQLASKLTTGGRSVQLHTSFLPRHLPLVCPAAHYSVNVLSASLVCPMAPTIDPYCSSVNIWCSPMGG